MTTMPKSRRDRAATKWNRSFARHLLPHVAWGRREREKESSKVSFGHDLWKVCENLPKTLPHRDTCEAPGPRAKPHVLTPTPTHPHTHPGQW